MDIPEIQNALTEKLARQVRTEAQDPEKLRDAAQKLESLFVKMLFSEMRKSMAPQGFFGEGIGGEVFQSMLEQNLSELLARREQFGIARLLQKQLARKNPEDRPERQLAPVNIREIARRAATATSLPVELIEAVIQQESAGRPQAVSAKGAGGLMQLMADTAREMGVSDVFDPEENVMGGSRYLKMLLDEFGDLPLALAAYNAGPQAVRKYGGIPPFAETQNYVAAIMQRLARTSETPSMRQKENAPLP